jgi:hypothetical protein
VSTDDQMSLEDRVRTATQAGASLIRDVRPLGAPAPVRLRRRPRPAPRRWVRWGAPLAAAAAVVAIALTLVVVRQPGTPSPAASGTGTAAPATIPRYYVSVTWVATGAHTGHAGRLLVGDDLTGKVIATVPSPPGIVLTNVSGTADNRTFVVQDAVSTAPTKPLSYTWYLLRITPGSAHPYQLTKLPVTLPRGTGFPLVYAVSPDGRELAVESMSGNAGRTVTTLGIYSISTGAQLRAWTAPAQSGFSGLSWPSGRQLVFRTNVGSARVLQLRTLDITGTGTDLVAGSRAVLTADNADTSACGSLQITPDGRTVICDGGAGIPGRDDPGACANGALKILAFPLPAQRQPGRVLYQYPGACHGGATYTLWTDASASSIIGVTEIDLTAPGGKEAFAIGVISGGRFRPLNIAKSITPDNYAALVF